MRGSGARAPQLRVSAHVGYVAVRLRLSFETSGLGELRLQLPEASGKLMHAEVRIDDAVVMLTE